MGKLIDKVKQVAISATGGATVFSHHSRSRCWQVLKVPFEISTAYGTEER